jgi:hypothetical protein
VSGVLLLPKPHLWDLREKRWQPLLVRNPWAECSLPNELLPLPGFKHVKEAAYAPTEGLRLPIFLNFLRRGHHKEHDDGMSAGVVLSTEQRHVCFASKSGHR